MTTTTDDTRNDDDRNDDTLREGTLRERKKSQTRRALHAAALRLVEEQGLEQATVEQICRDADVSPRTFFNYFPSKAAAALDLPEQVIDEQAAEHFRSARGRLVDALCDLFAETADLHADRARMKELIVRRPELIPAMTQWMTGLREQVIGLAQERAHDPEQAQLAMTLVMAALGSVIHDRDRTDDRPTAERLRERVGQLVAVHAAKLN